MEEQPYVTTAISVKYNLEKKVCPNLKKKTVFLGDLPLIMYAPRRRERQASYIFLLHITCKIGGGGREACKNAHVINETN